MSQKRALDYCPMLDFPFRFSKKRLFGVGWGVEVERECVFVYWVTVVVCVFECAWVCARGHVCIIFVLLGEG